METHITDVLEQFHQKNIHLKIDKKNLEASIDSLFEILFPICSHSKKNYDLQKRINNVSRILSQNITNIPEVQNPKSVVFQFINALPALQIQLFEDAKSFYKNDPAAQSIEEVILSYPGFYALAVHRMANVLFNLNVPIIPRLWSEYAHRKGGIDIHPGATIGNRFFLDHGTGVVIGETCIIGNDVKIYQNVTLGALHVNKTMQFSKRHPTVQDGVIIYAGATILGGTTIIGSNSIIGGNVWLTKSVLPHSLIYFSLEMEHKNTPKTTNPINFII